jgi:aerobic carbon-monoxide dehydrogenase large subunit
MTAEVAGFARFGSGRAVQRVEDFGLLTGVGKYADDVALAGQSHLYTLRSPYPHARIKSIDTKAAAAMPGALMVMTGADLAAAGVKPLFLAPMFARPDGKPASAPPRPALAVEVVRFVGEPVAAVVATSPAAARDAAEAIEVSYEPLPHVTTIAEAIAPGAPQLWPEAQGNCIAEMRHGDAAATAAAFAKAAHVVALELDNQRLAPTPLEPRSSLGTWDAATQRVTLRLSSQMPSGARDTLAEQVFGVPKESIRVVVGDVGGGFGMKTGIFPEDILLMHAVRTLKRPVKWTAERIEEFLGATHGRDIASRAELAFDASGKILAYRINTLANVGGYPGTVGIIIQLLIGPFVATSIYDIRTVDFRLGAVMTNTAPTAPYRGAGRPEAIYVTERLMDAAARRIGIDPTELRRRNMIRPEQMPYTNPMGQVYDSGKFEQVMNRALALADWAGFPARYEASRKRGKLRGRGIATFLEWTGGNALSERVTVEVKGDGIEIVTATQAMGQGIVTSYAQLAVDVFGVPIEKVRIVQGDSDRSEGFGSAGSRSLFTGGSALRVAAEETVARGKELAAEALEAAAGEIEYVAGVFQVAGTDHRIGLFELAAKQPDRRIFVDRTTQVAAPTWPNGCHICEVEIEPETGVVALQSYASVNDVGRAVNPMIVVGQLDGGAAQGIGQALCEQVVYDKSGQAVTASFMDYAMPRADQIALFKTELDQTTPCLTNPLGVKGVGELGTIGATPTVVNAVADALARAGKSAAADRLQMPLTPETVWNALNRAG